MDFLKRHYEKVILLGLFVLFIALMFMVEGIISSTKEVKESDLKIPKQEANHQIEDEKDTKFSPAVQWENTKLTWLAVDGGKMRGDLVHVFEIAECPYCREKSTNKDYMSLIPLSSFGRIDEGTKKLVAGNCPRCGHDLPRPPEQRKLRIGIKTDSDLDGDGIPNETEKKYGMNENDPDDALYDLDKDGFSNIFEIENGFDPTNAASHPPFWWRLRLKGINQIELPVRFASINDFNMPNDKKQWELQFNTINSKGKTRTDDHQLGGTLYIENREYKIVDVVRKIEDKKVKGVMATGEVDKIDLTKVYLTEVLPEDSNLIPDKLEMTIGKPAYSSDKRPILEDVGVPGGKTYGLRIGSEFRIPADFTGRRRRNSPRYRVTTVDSDKLVVFLEESGKEENPVKMEITAEGKIPSDMRVIDEKKMEQENAPEDI